MFGEVNVGRERKSYIGNKGGSMKETKRYKLLSTVSEKHIVETKSQDIKEAVQNYKKYIKEHGQAIKNAMTNLNDAVEKIRAKHEKEI